MKYLFLLFICLFFLCRIRVTAQDIIKLKDSTEIKAKIETITPGEVVFKKADSLSGPDCTIKKSKIERLIFANGVTQQINKGLQYKLKKHHGTAWLASDNKAYGRNILSFAFIQSTDASISQGGGAYPGIGVHYERMLNDHSRFSFYFPFTVSFYTTSGYVDGSTYSNQNTHPFFYTYPGFKYYPMGNHRLLGFSVGLSLAAGFGNKYHTDLNDTTGLNTFATENRQVLKIGPMANTGIDIMLTKHLYLGAEFGIGITIYDNDYDEDDNTESYKNHVSDLFQVNAKAGYRF
jgi:hypothetical protein